MPDEPQSHAHAESQADGSDAWQGLPLQLEGTPGEEDTPLSGRDTVAQTLPPQRPPAVCRSAPLAHALLLWSGMPALALALAALTATALQGVLRVDWRGPLLAFDAAVVLLVLCGLAAAGVPAARLCRRFAGVAGLAVAALTVLGTLLHAIDEFIHGAPPASMLPEALAFGLLGLGGCVVFVEFLRDRGWAYRTAAAAAAAFVPLAVLRMGQTTAPAAARESLALWTKADYAVALAACAVVGAGLATSRRLLGVRRSRWRTPLSVAWLLILLAAVAFTTFLMIRNEGVQRASVSLWAAAAAWCAPAYGVLLTAGLTSAWRRRGPAGADALQSTAFAWQLVAAVGLVLLALGLHSHGWTAGLDSLLIAGGVAAALAVARLATRYGSWTGRWALLPIAGAAMAAACSLRRLFDLGAGMNVGRTEAWDLAAALLWCIVVVGFAHAFFGALVARRQSRAVHPARALQDDVALLTTAGGLLAGLWLAAALALWLGRPEAVAGVRTVLAVGASFLNDLATLGSAPGAWTAVGRAADAALSVPAVRLLAGVAAAGAVLVHVLARSGVRWALRAVAAAWCAALTAATAFALTCAGGLFTAPPAAEWATTAGRVLASRFPARLAAMLLLSAMVARFWQAAPSALRSARAGARAAGPAWPHRPGWASAHLRFLVIAGVVLSAVGLTLAVLIDLHPQAEGILFEWTRLARGWAQGAAGLAWRIGRRAGTQGRFAIAVGAAAYALLMVHEEARNGRPAVYPLVAVLWLGLLTPLGADLVRQARALPRPAMPGRIAALGVAGALALILGLAALALLVRWRAVRREGGLDEPDQSPAAAVSRAAGQALGTLGLLLTLAGGLAVLHGMLEGRAASAGIASGLGRIASDVGGLGALQVARLELALSERGNAGIVALLLAAAAGLSLLLHAVARHRVLFARSAVYAVWFVGALAALVALGLLAHGHPPGTWSGARIGGCLALGALIVRTGIALASPGGWLEQRAGGFR